jgi:hypothetical protein
VVAAAHGQLRNDLIRRLFYDCLAIVRALACGAAVILADLVNGWRGSCITSAEDAAKRWWKVCRPLRRRDDQGRGDGFVTGDNVMTTDNIWLLMR